MFPVSPAVLGYRSMNDSLPRVKIGSVFRNAEGRRFVVKSICRAAPEELRKREAVDEENEECR